MLNGPYFQLYIYVDAIDYKLSYCLPFIALVQKIITTKFEYSEFENGKLASYENTYLLSI